MLHISRTPSPRKRTQQAMSVNADSDHLFDSTRRPYIRPAAVWVDCSPVPQHWDLLTSEIKDLDISEEDGYVLSANGEGSTSGVFVPCEPLSAIRRARPGRLRIKPLVLHRRRVVGITTSPISPTVSSPSLPLPPITSLTLDIQPPPSLPRASGSAVASLLLPRRPTRTSRTSSTASGSAMHTLRQKSRLQRCHRPCSSLRLPHPSCRARPLPYASNGPCSTCRRAPPSARELRPLLHRCPLPAPVRPNSGRLDGCRSARSSLFGPPNIIPVPWLFDRLVRSPPSSQLALLLSWDAPYFYEYPRCTTVVLTPTVCIDIAFLFGEPACRGLSGSIPSHQSSPQYPYPSRNSNFCEMQNLSASVFQSLTRILTSL
ncbi:hypothetical protein BC826DRAFT_1185481 [Russula brevipes]|nr:hypothetical protein BC826DRAFT_1185481 [Russula brevipes]